jgi:hypothetical protein
LYTFNGIWIIKTNELDELIKLLLLPIALRPFQFGLGFLELIKQLNIINYVNPLNAKLNPICHLLALLGTHTIFHVSRIRDKVQRFSWFGQINRTPETSIVKRIHK